MKNDTLYPRYLRPRVVEALADSPAVLESGGGLAGVEVKAGATVTADDFKGLRRLRQAAPRAFWGGRGPL